MNSKINLESILCLQNLEQAPEGYGYEFLNTIEVTVTNNKNMADARLLLKAHYMGANAILKYEARYTAYTHGTVTSL
ncbi:MAG: hypothetical protein Q9M36_08380 [Sulfurovum sp.]|nr:hypothetical protein [Sulfurovum sp.]